MYLISTTKGTIENEYTAKWYTFSTADVIETDFNEEAWVLSMLFFLM